MSSTTLLSKTGLQPTKNRAKDIPDGESPSSSSCTATERSASSSSASASSAASSSCVIHHRLDRLPHDAVSQILDMCCSDFTTIFNLAESSNVFQRLVYKQQWTCRRCSDRLFVGPTLETNRHATPFVCAVCHNKLCGEAIDYGRRYCRPQKCDGCGRIECYDCQQAHMHDSDGYGTENYCQECQAEFEFGMGGC